VLIVVDAVNVGIGTLAFGRPTDSEYAPVVGVSANVVNPDG
jgi:hypothetical protein